MAQASVARLGPGDAFTFKDQPFVVIQVRAKHMGRGGAIYRLKMRNLKTGTVLNNGFRPTDKFELLDLEWRPAKFLYLDKQKAYFMDPRTFEQEELSLEIIADFAKFLKDGETYRIKFIDDQPVGLEPPLKIKRQVIEAPEAVAGNTATGASKKVEIEGGIKIETPLFIKKGEIIIVNTKTGAYVSRG